MYLIVLGLGVALIIAWRRELTAIWADHALALMVLTLMMAAGIVLQALNFMAFLPDRIQHLKLRRVAHLWALGSLANYLGPLQPGAALRVAMLRKLDVPALVASTAMLRQLALTCLISIVLVALVIRGVTDDPRLAAAAVLGAVTAALAVLGIRFSTTIEDFAARVVGPRFGSHVIEAIQVPSPRAAAGVAAQIGLGSLMFMYGYDAFGAEISVAEGIFLAAAVYLSSVFPLLPGNLGVLEAICAGFGAQVGMSPEEAVALALLYRASNIAGAGLLVLVRPGDS